MGKTGRGSARLLRSNIKISISRVANPPKSERTVSLQRKPISLTDPQDLRILGVEKISGKRPSKTVLRDGTKGIIREIGPEDREALREAFRELSEESRLRRFFFHKSQLSPSEIDYLATPDGNQHLAFGLAVLDESIDEEEPIAITHCFRHETDPTLGELALVTADLWQGNGAGTALLKTLSTACLHVGIEKWYATLLEDNKAMFHLLQKFGTLEKNEPAGTGVREIICKITQDPA